MNDWDLIVLALVPLGLLVMVVSVGWCVLSALSGKPASSGEEAPAANAPAVGDEAQQRAVAEAEERARHRAAVEEELRKWDAYCDLGTYLVAFNDYEGVRVHGELVQFENVVLEEEPVPIVTIQALLPEVYPARGSNSAYFEFERDILLRPAQILEAQKVPVEIDAFDLAGLGKWQQKARELAAKYQ